MIARIPMYLIAVLVLCAAAVSTVVAETDYPFLEFESRYLGEGRALWIENCKGRHGDGTADASVPMRPEEWRHRFAKGNEVLYKHAIEGFCGTDDTHMPERGGNPALSDAQGKGAVDCMRASPGTTWLGSRRTSHFNGVVSMLKEKTNE